MHVDRAERTRWPERCVAISEKCRRGAPREGGDSDMASPATLERRLRRAALRPHSQWAVLSGALLPPAAAAVHQRRSDRLPRRGHQPDAYIRNSPVQLVDPLALYVVEYTDPECELDGRKDRCGGPGGGGDPLPPMPPLTMPPGPPGVMLATVGVDDAICLALHWAHSVQSSSISGAEAIRSNDGQSLAKKSRKSDKEAATDRARWATCPRN